MVSIIWTKHAQERLRERKIDESSINNVLNAPDNVLPGKQGGSEYHKKVGEQTFIALIKENEVGQKVIISAWVNPPNPGTQDFKRKQRYLQMQKAPFLKKLWLTFLDQIGL